MSDDDDERRARQQAMQDRFNDALEYWTPPAGAQSTSRRYGPGSQSVRPLIEHYLRATVIIPGGSIEAGLQRSRGEPLTLLRSELARVIADEALVLNGSDVTDETAGRLIDAIETRLTDTWPARAWFVEVWQADEALCQVYAPYGMPRVR